MEREQAKKGPFGSRQSVRPRRGQEGARGIGGGGGFALQGRGGHVGNFGRHFPKQGSVGH